MNQTATKKCFQKYTAYKDSGIPWLGNIPEHWEASRLGTILNPISSKNHPNKPLLSITREQGVIIRDIENETENHNYIPDDLTGYKLLKKGQFGMNKMKAWQGSYGVSEHTGIVSPAYFIFEFIEKIEPRYFHLAIRSKLFVAFFGQASDGVRIGQWDLSKERMKQIPFLLPPLPEQTAIANFLDDKTAKIDKAVSIKEQQIALLKERKQILIHELVTGKLVWNPDTKTWTKPTEVKDSGVEWIGEIPAHWEVKKIKYLFNLIQTGTTPTTSNINYFDGDVDWYNPKDLNEELLIASERKVSDLAVQKGEIKIFPGDSILVVGIGATSGKTSFLRNKGTFNQQITGFYSNINHNKFYFYLLKNLASVMLNTANYTTLPILNNEFFKRFVLVQPSFSEQQQIASHIKSTSQKIDQTISLKEREIEKLKEYKTSLINSVVTGKVRVN